MTVDSLKCSLLQIKGTYMGPLVSLDSWLLDDSCLKSHNLEMDGRACLGL